MLIPAQLRTRLRNANWPHKYRLENVHDKRRMGRYCHCAHREFASLLDSPKQLTQIPQAVYWIETKGKTLEEIDAIFAGEKHSNVPDVAAVRAGEASVNVKEIEEEVREIRYADEKVQH